MLSEVTYLETSGQDGGIGRHASPLTQLQKE